MTKVELIAKGDYPSKNLTEKRVFASSSHALLYFKEDNEHKRSQISVHTTNHYQTLRCCHGSCAYVVKLVPKSDSATGEYVCKKYVEHDHNSTDLNKNKQKVHNYSSADLSPTLHDYILSDEEVSRATCGNILKKYLHRPPSESSLTGQLNL